MSEQVDVIVNLIVIGEANVGKTNMINKYVSDKFSDSTMPTIGLDYQTKEIKLEDQVYSVKFWDTAGQERFQSMIRRVFKQANGVILVYDITNRKSFQLIPNWLKRLEEEIQSNIPKILIGNKKDLEK